MFGHHSIGTKIKTSAGVLQIAGDPMIGGEGAGYKARLGGREVFFKQYAEGAAADMDADQARRHRWARVRWIVRARLDLLDARINAPFAITASGESTPPGYVCAWIDSLATLEQWRGLSVPYADRVNVVGQLAHLLSLLHAQGVAQGDLNAANVGIVGAGPDLEVHLFDFGNYNNGDRSLRPLMAGEAEHMAWWLRAGRVAPDRHSDVYALGVMAYELLLARPVTAGCTDVNQMLERLEHGRLPGDPLLGAAQGADTGLPYGLLPPSLQTLLRNMLAPDPVYTPRVDSFCTCLRAEIDRLIACGHCGMPYWWTPQRERCPSCSAPVPAALSVSLPSGGIVPIHGNTMLGRATLGGAAHLSAQHLLLQPLAPRAAAAFVKGRNGAILIRKDGARSFLPQGSGPVALAPGDRMEICGTPLEFCE